MPTGRTVAYSDNKLDEDANANLFQQELSGNLAQYLDDSAWSVRDFYSMNPRDAGMRLVLPGPIGQTTLSTYFVRVYQRPGDAKPRRKPFGRWRDVQNHRRQRKSGHFRVRLGRRRAFGQRCRGVHAGR